MNQSLEIQKYLVEKQLTPLSVLLPKLEAEYGIAAKQHSVYPNLWLFKYSMVESDFSHRIVQECRGIILDQSNGWKVVSFPFTKFFNFSESLSAPIDWSTAKVQEKLDGSLIQAYFYDNQWHVATSGCPDGLNQVGDFNKTFGELFWECFKTQDLSVLALNPVYTYMWELTSPFNRVVCDHKKSRVTLIGVRDVRTSQEISVSQFKGLFPVVQEYPLTNVAECLDAAGKLNPLENEGYVVCDLDFHRVKIKSPAYIALHHLKDRCSLSRLAEIIRIGEYQEFSLALEAYPELKLKFLEMVKTYENVVNWCNLTYSLVSYIKDQKEFAVNILNDPYKTVLFTMRKTGKSPQAVLKDLSENAYLRLLGIKE